MTGKEEWLTPDEVADEIRSSSAFVIRELKRKNLRGTKLGVGWRISRGDLQTYMAAKANVSAVRRRAAS